jgi:hypothetical protein
MLLLCAICLMLFHSFCHCALLRGSESILFIKNLYAASLCSRGWLERKLMVVSVAVGWFFSSLLHKMHGHTYIKFVCAKQAKDIHAYKNIKRRLYRTSAAIWINKTCKIKQLTPAYMAIKINSNNQQDRNTLRMATAHRLSQEIKFLHINKSRLNEQLYVTHLRCAALWPGSWPYIQDIVDNNLQKEMEVYYDGLNKKT